MNKVSMLKDDKEVLETVDRVRGKVLAGGITGVMIVTENRDGTYGVHGSGCNDSRQFAGALLELAVRRLSFGYRDEDVS